MFVFVSKMVVVVVVVADETVFIWSECTHWPAIQTIRGSFGTGV